MQVAINVVQSPPVPSLLRGLNGRRVWGLGCDVRGLAASWCKFHVIGRTAQTCLIPREYLRINIMRDAKSEVSVSYQVHGNLSISVYKGFCFHR